MSEPSKTTLPPQMLKNAKKWAKISGKTLYVYWSPAMGRPMFAEGPPSDPKRFKVLAIVSPDGSVKKMHGKKATAVAEAQDPFDVMVDLSRGAFAGYQGPLAEAKAPPKPVGKAQIALMTYLKKSHTAGGPMFPKNELTDVVRHPMFRAMHFGKVSKAASVLAKKGLVKFDGLKISLVEGSTKHGQSMSSGFSRDAKLMAPGTRELVLKSRMTEIEAFAEDRGYDPAMVFAVAEVSMRMGRVPDLRQYGFAGEDAKAVRHFVAGDILNIAVEDVQHLRRAPGCSYGSAGALPVDLEEDQLEEGRQDRQLGLHTNSDGSGFTALTHSASKTFKSRGGAVRWLKKRGYDEKGGRIKQEDEDWSEAEALCEATALRAPGAAHVLANSLSGDLDEDRVHRNAAGPAMTETAYNILATPAAAPTGSDVDKMAKEIEKALAPLYKGRYLSVKAQDVFGQAKSVHIRAGNITPAMIKHNVAWHNDPYKFQAIVGGFLKDGSAGPKINVEQIAGHYNKKRMRKKTIKPGKESLMVQHIKKYVTGLMKDAPAPRAEDVGALDEAKVKPKIRREKMLGHQLWVVSLSGKDIGSISKPGRDTKASKSAWAAYVGIGSKARHVGNYWDKKKAANEVVKAAAVAEDVEALAEEGLSEVSPPGWSGSVRAMKGEPAEKLKKYADEPKSDDEKSIDNPWALAWYMHKKGAKPHYKPEKGKPKYTPPKKKKEEDADLRSAVAAFRAMED